MQSVMDYANTFHAEFMVVNIDMPDCSEMESAMAFVQHKQAQLQQLFSMDGSTERVILINSGNCPSYVGCTNGRIHYNTEQQKVAFLDSLSSHSYSYETTFCEAMEATFGTCIQRKENSAIATVKMPACAYSHIGSIDEYVDCSSNVQVNSVLYSKSTHDIKMRATSGPFHLCLIADHSCKTHMDPGSSGMSEHPCSRLFIDFIAAARKFRHRPDDRLIGHLYLSTVRALCSDHHEHISDAHSALRSITPHFLREVSLSYGLVVPQLSGGMNRPSWKPLPARSCISRHASVSCYGDDTTSVS